MSGGIGGAGRAGKPSRASSRAIGRGEPSHRPVRAILAECGTSRCRQPHRCAIPPCMYGWVISHAIDAHPVKHAGAPKHVKLPRKQMKTYRQGMLCNLGWPCQSCCTTLWDRWSRCSSSTLRGRRTQLGMVHCSSTSLTRLRFHSGHLLQSHGQRQSSTLTPHKINQTNVSNDVQEHGRHDAAATPALY